ncbi:PREDICTED: RCC1 domain-containing protein 1 isoform X6 [Capra hircus]|uniref:RCC1 domain-containing protein 1 isoform X6 n=1 Tax=Capra hircus TaxID=9925 RepID=UPI00084637F5|nr:PREDICTED: RCC1 domain-containing protein 1 isoform X6 [Capra hircus]XP_017921977.1 PREDICTED: RCC1 domain-containing protein 1 isoform X6 [Capra hircus]
MLESKGRDRERAPLNTAPNRSKSGKDARSANADGMHVLCLWWLFPLLTRKAAAVSRKGSSGTISPGSCPNPPSSRPLQPGRSQPKTLRGMDEERRGTWFGFGFCGFGQALGSGLGRQVHSPEPVRTPSGSVDVCRVSASWSYTAFVTRGGRVQLSGAAGGAADGYTDAWASEELLVLLRAGPGAGAELQAWAPGSALRGEPLWSQAVQEAEHGANRDETQAGLLPLLPCARAYVSPRPPFYRPLAPTLRARRLELGAEHALLLDAAGQVFSWGAGRHGQLGHGTLEPEPEPRLLEALQGLRMAEVAAGGWHSVCLSETGDIYIWGWNESGQLALPTKSLAEDGKTTAGEGVDQVSVSVHRHYHHNSYCFSEASGLDEDGSEVKRVSAGEDGAPAPFIAVQPFPALLDLSPGSEAVKVSCGSRHTAVLTRTGELYTWGWGKYGQLGHKDTTTLDRPCRVEYFVDKQLQVRTVSCGPWNTYVYAVEKEKS